MSAIDALLNPIPLPHMALVRQHFARPVLDGIAASLNTQLRESACLAALRPGQRVGITAGSRGISNMPLILRTVVRAVRAAGAEPFIFPAMGSHGGATAQGQAAMLRDLGVEQATVEAPICSSMETVLVCESHDGLPVYMDALAHAADGVIIVNRIKPHVSFRGPYESGLMKMLALGVGKQRGADLCHRAGYEHMAHNVAVIGKALLDNAPIVCGVAILENAYHETARVEIVPARAIAEREPHLLDEAWRLSARLFFDALDVLVLDEIGKDISGTGFDTNVVGRYHSSAASGGPRITRALALDLTDISHGNANGLGILDFTTQRLYNKFSREHTYPNALTSTAPLAVKMPMVLRNDRQAIQAAIKTCHIDALETVRLVRIKNTVALDTLWVSQSLLPYCVAHECLEVLGTPAPFVFNDAGNLF